MSQASKHVQWCLNKAKLDELKKTCKEMVDILKRKRNYELSLTFQDILIQKSQEN